MWTGIAELHVWCKSAQLVAEWNVQYNGYSIQYNVPHMYERRYTGWENISVRMSHHGTGVVYWNIPRSQDGSSSGIQIHQDTYEDIRHRIHTRFTLHSHKLPDKIRGNEYGILYRATEGLHSFIYLSQPSYSLHKAPRYIYSTMVCYSTIQSVTQDVM